MTLRLTRLIGAYLIRDQAESDRAPFYLTQPGTTYPVKLQYCIPYSLTRARPSPYTLVCNVSVARLLILPYP
jgi:hypothetical protein